VKTPTQQQVKHHLGSNVYLVGEAGKQMLSGAKKKRKKAWAKVKTGAKKIGSAVKKGIKKVGSAIKKVGGKVVNFVNETILGNPEDKGTVKEKFVLSSSGGGSRAMFGFFSFIEGYKNGLSDLIKDTEFIATNSGSSWMMNRVLMENGYPDAKDNKLEWVERVHTEMAGYKTREKKITTLKKKYAHEKFNFKVNDKVILFGDDIQCLATLTRDNQYGGILDFTKIRKAKEETMLKMKTSIKKYFGSWKKFRRYMKRQSRNGKTAKTGVIEITIDCDKKTIEGMPEDPCCKAGKTVVSLYRFEIMGQVIHFNKEALTPVRLIPAKTDETEQRLMISELLQMGVFASWFPSLSMVGLGFNFLNAHVLDILDGEHRGWRDFVRQSSMVGVNKVNSRETIWRQMVAIGTTGAFYDHNKDVHTYSITCNGETPPKLLSVYITVTNSDNPTVHVDIPYFENKNERCVFKTKQLRYVRAQLPFESILNPRLPKHKQCSVPIADPTTEEETHNFNSPQIARIVTDTYTALWEKEPYFMSAASSNFPGMAGSEQLLDRVDVFNSDSKKIRPVNDWARKMVFGIVNTAGNELKDRVFRPQVYENYHFNIPNPNLVEQSSSKTLNFNLLDGGYIDNTGIALSVYYMQREYKTAKEMPKLVALLHSSTLEGNIEELKKLFEFEGGLLDIVEGQIFQGKFDSAKLRKTCEEAMDHQESYCYSELKVTTQYNPIHGVAGGTQITIVAIIPLSFKGLPVMTLFNSKQGFIDAYKALSKDSAIENAIVQQKLKRQNSVIKWLGDKKKTIKSAYKTIASGINLLAKTRSGLRKYSDGGILKAVGKLLRTLTWARKFPKGTCSYKYKNKQVYKDTVGLLLEMKHKLGAFDDKTYANNGINNAQELYQKYLEEEERQMKEDKDGDFLSRLTGMSPLLEVAMAKLVRFFPTYSNYLNVCGFGNTGRRRCKYYEESSKLLFPNVVKYGYFKVIIDSINDGLKASQPNHKWYQFGKKLKNWLGMGRVIKLLSAISSDLENKKCETEMIDGLLSLFDGLVVQFAFEYAGTETELDKFNLEQDAADFFTSEYEGVSDEKFEEKKTLRLMIRNLYEQLGTGTISIVDSDEKLKSQESIKKRSNQKPVKTKGNQNHFKKV
jgi:hypothetical protein